MIRAKATQSGRRLGSAPSRLTEDESFVVACKTCDVVLLLLAILDIRFIKNNRFRQLK